MKPGNGIWGRRRRLAAGVVGPFLHPAHVCRAGIGGISNFMTVTGETRGTPGRFEDHLRAVFPRRSPERERVRLRRRDPTRTYFSATEQFRRTTGSRDRITQSKTSVLAGRGKRATVEPGKLERKEQKAAAEEPWRRVRGNSESSGRLAKRTRREQDHFSPRPCFKEGRAENRN